MYSKRPTNGNHSQVEIDEANPMKKPKIGENGFNSLIFGLKTRLI